MKDMRFRTDGLTKILSGAGLPVLLLLLAGCPSPPREYWSEEFEGKALSEDTWNFELGDGCPGLCGWGNNEAQVYTRTNHRLEDGKLVITARKEDSLFF